MTGIETCISENIDFLIGSISAYLRGTKEIPVTSENVKEVFLDILRRSPDGSMKRNLYDRLTEENYGIRTDNLSR